MISRRFRSFVVAAIVSLTGAAQVFAQATPWDCSNLKVSVTCGICPNSGGRVAAVFTICNDGETMQDVSTYDMYHDGAFYSSTEFQIGARTCMTACDSHYGAVKMVVNQRPSFPGPATVEAATSCVNCLPPPTTLCHIPNGDPTKAYTIQVGEDQVATHIAHGDTVGECPVDCKGIPNGQAVVDVCGVCGGDGSSCKDCAGVPNGGQVLDQCGVCGGNNSTCKGCDGVPNSGQAIDACGVCGGDSSSCKDCNGVPNGGAVIDQCGKCGGNNTSCLDCAGIPNGPNQINSCGICAVGETGCVTGCQGTFDRCGVCNGNSACLDCAGIPNGGTTLDCCGVCGGDGSSCKDKCTFYDLAKVKEELKRDLKKLGASVTKLFRAEKKCSKKKPSQNLSVLATQLVQQSLGLLAAIKDQEKYCDTSFCSKVNFESVIATIRSNVTKLHSAVRVSQYRTNKACGVSPGKNGKSLADKLRDNLQSVIQKLPPIKCQN